MEGLSQAALIKSLSPRVMLSNHLLPKGTKMKVNLEDQSRQKVSFSFSQTKKPLHSLFVIPTSPEKPAAEPHAALSQSTSDKGWESTDDEMEQSQPVPTATAETPSQMPVSSAATKLKTDLAKIHFKKQILSVSVTEEKLSSVVPEEAPSSEKSASKSAPEFPTHHIVSVGPSENAHHEASEKRNLKKPAVSTGKDGESVSSSKQDSTVSKRITRSHSGSGPTGSESDDDSVQMSSSQKSVDSKSRTNPESSSKAIRRFSSHVEEREKSSSKRSETYERLSCYSKSDRDSRYTSSRSARLDKDRRRSRSRSRSKSRGSRTSSSHSRSERSRGDRGSRSERSYYHDSDRRSHRSSPRRDRRRSRSRNDRTRDSSDSEDDYRKTRTRTSDSSRSSTHSSSHKESKFSSSSRSDKASKSVDSPHSSDVDRRTQSLKSERTSRRPSDSDSQSKCSQLLDSSYRKSSGHHKSEATSRPTVSSQQAPSQTCDKQQSDPEADHKGKSQSFERNPASEENTQSDPWRSVSSVTTAGHDQQGGGGEVLTAAAAFQTYLHGNMEETQRETQRKTHGGQEFVLCVDTSLDKSSSNISNKTRHEVETENTSAISSSESVTHVSTALENPINVNISSQNAMHMVSAQLSLNSSGGDSSTMFSRHEEGLNSSVPNTTDVPITHDILLHTAPQVAEPKEVLTVRLPVVSDSSKLESQLATEQPNPDTVKKRDSTARKSRWDIVGQDSWEGDNSLRTPGPPVKTMISVQKSEFSKDSSQQDVKDCSLQPFEIHSRMLKQAGSTSVTNTHKDQGTPTDRFDKRLTNSEQINDTSQVGNTAMLQSWTNKGQSEDRAQKSKSNKRTSVGGRSDASESDNSEYDSDCGDVIKRLHSVVVVPKNSSLTSDAQQTGASSCSGANASALQSASLAPVVSVSEAPHQLSTPPTQENELVIRVPCQSQSNMIDSTSHSEGPGSASVQPYMTSHGGAPDPRNDLANSRHCEHKQLKGGERAYPPYRHADDVTGKNGFNPGWDFAEQPSSTYQQPDSSHGPHLSNARLVSASPKREGERNVPWSQQTPDGESSRKPYLHVHEHYQELVGEIHPDSLTSDHDDYSVAKPSGPGKAPVDCNGSNASGSSFFVQGHEISSNSRGSTAPDPQREDVFKPHRGRGPPKKRRPEIESDSDNEAEAGPAGKRGREGQSDEPKEAHVKAEVQRPSLTLHDFRDANKWKDSAKSKKMPPYFDLIEENLYLTER